MAALIQKMWDVSWDMWDHQNKKLHDGDLSRQIILHSAADAKLEILYEDSAQQLTRDALKFLRTPKETVLVYPLSVKAIMAGLGHSGTATQEKMNLENIRANND